MGLSATFDKDLSSIAKTAEFMQLPPREIEAAAERKGLRPALRLNGVAYYDAKQIEILSASISKGTSK